MSENRAGLQVAVVGTGDPDPDAERLAALVGARLACAGALVVTGGLGGVMAAASRGAKEAGGRTLGLLPGDDPAAANPWVDVVVPTGLGEARNTLVVRAARGLVAIAGGWGTLSEIALAVRAGKPVVGLGTWAVQPPGPAAGRGIVPVGDPDLAVATLLALLGRGEPDAR